MPIMHIDTGVQERWWLRLRTDRLLQARLLLGAALLAHAVLLLLAARGWFFAGDDWDYLARDGLGDVMAPHGGHITAFLATATVAVRSAVGLDYWPAYPLVIAVVWPAVALAAWWVWRRSDVEPVPAAAGSALVAWLAIGAYPLFGHTAMATVMVVFLIAVRIDERPLDARGGAASFGLSLFAVLADSSGVVVTAVRAATGLGYRKWTAVAGAVPALVIHFIIRALVGSDRSLSFSFGFDDVGTTARVIVRLAGTGIREILLLPVSLEGAAVVVFAIGTVWLLVRHRFGHRAVTLVAAGVGYLGAVAVVRYLPSQTNLSRLFERGYENSYMLMRYAVPLVLAVVVLAVPLVVAWTGRGRTRLRRWSMAGLASLLVLSGVLGTIDVFGRIADRSVPAAQETAAFAGLVGDGEPVVDPDRRAGLANNQMFTFEILQRFEEWDLTDGLLASEIIGSGAVEVTAADREAARGQMRFAFTGRHPTGSWSEVGWPGREGCLAADGLELSIGGQVSVGLEVDGEVPGGVSLMIRWEDGFGVGTRRIEPAVFGHSGRKTVRIAAPADVETPALVTFAGTGVRVCLEP